MKGGLEINERGNSSEGAKPDKAPSASGAKSLAHQFYQFPSCVSRAPETPRQREEVLNGQLGTLLIERHPHWNESNVHIESSNTITGRPQLKIDLLIENPGGQPVAIETKFDSPSVGKALSRQMEQRIGLSLKGSGRIIESGITVRWPKLLTAAQIDDTQLSFAVHQMGQSQQITRWPERVGEWMTGSVDDLVDAIEIVSLSERRILEGSEILKRGVQQASSRLSSSNAPIERLADVLHQGAGEQTTRMAVAIIINAFVFHHAIEEHVGIPDVSDGMGETGFLKSLVLQVWQAVLQVNYWPIFSIATNILEVLPARYANPLLDSASKVAEELTTVGATTFHDLAARMFQVLIADRKFLATFYTLPESAHLLAEVAVAKLNLDWSDEAAVKALRVADFACGTGTLLSAVQAVIYRKLRRQGFDDKDFHKHLMENTLLGTDIMPSAAHLAASMLSSAHPDTLYFDSLIHVMPYGIDEQLSERNRVDRDRIYIGALDLRTTELSSINLFSQSGFAEEVAIQGERMTGSGARHLGERKSFPVGHGSFDLVIMNPPFTRPTNHEGDFKVPVPSFAGFRTSESEQKAMSKRLEEQGSEFGHGNAGLASNFMDLAHDKLKEGGVLALVLPFSFVSGKAWHNARRALSRHYTDISVYSIAASKSINASFSADTALAECLVVARRSKEGTPGPSEPKQVRFINLERRPTTRVEANEYARGKCPAIDGTDRDYGAAGIQNAGMGTRVLSLSRGTLSLARSAHTYDLPLTELKHVATRGLVDRDISGKPPRGAFDIREIRAHGTVDYPALWNHDHQKERRLVVPPDREGFVRAGMQSKALEIWEATTSQLHHNRDFRLNSQSLAVCMTPQPSIGGSAWPNIRPIKCEYTAPLLLWGNSTLGLMLFWWCGTRQQQGRTRLTITKIPELPTIDCAALTDAQLRRFQEAFDDLKDLRFLPANEAYRDDSRKLLDATLFDILGIPDTELDGLDVLRNQWCYEPSVHGGKSTRPRALDTVLNQ